MCDESTRPLPAVVWRSGDLVLFPFLRIIVVKFGDDFFEKEKTQYDAIRVGEYHAI